jgi:hypothetical protein
MALRLVSVVVLAAGGLTLATVAPSSAAGTNILANGGFESGSFSPGWTADNAGSGGWGVSSTGTSALASTNAPDEGNFTALFDQTDPTSGVLVSNAFTVPSNSNLSLDFAYVNDGPWTQSGTPFDLTLGLTNQWLRVDVIKASAADTSLAPSDVLLTLFNSQSGSPSLTQNWETLSTSLASLAGQSVELRIAAVDTYTFMPVWVDGVDVTGAPPAVTNLGVSAGTDSVSASWAPSGNASSYTCTLMYGFNTPSDFTMQTTSPSCTFTGLVPGSTWGIQVVATNYGQSSSPVLAFATVPVPPTPKPTPKPPVRHRIVCKQNHGKKLRSFAGVSPHCPSGYHRVG